MTDKKTSPAGLCCPKFDPAAYDGKEFVWKDKLFIRDTVTCIFHIPLNIAQVMTRMWKMVESSRSQPSDFICLSCDPSPWQSHQYMAVSKKVPGAKNVTLSGTFIAKVFDGPYADAPKWMKSMEQYLKSLGKNAQKMYLYYTTCPKCAKVYGHNYVVVIAQLSS